MAGFDPRLTTIPNSIPKAGTQTKSTRTRTTGTKTTEPGFGEVFHQALKGQSLKFSLHAQKRLDTRGIRLNQQQISDLEGAVEKARSKSARESLILMEDCAFVVSVPNKTVITVIDGENLKENVFTNIDSAVIV